MRFGLRGYLYGNDGVGEVGTRDELAVRHRLAIAWREERSVLSLD